ncbi:MAG: DNA polymerase III subunit delta, partial [Abditibacteriaceae bacterium]
MLTYSGLKKSTVFKNDQPQRCYGVLGDAYLQQRTLNFLLEQILPPDERDFNQDILEGESATANDLMARAEQLPFIASHRVVIIRSADKMDGVGRAAAGEAKPKSTKVLSPGQQLAEALKKIPPSTVLIIMRTPETPDSFGKSAPRCLNAILDKIIESQGVIINCLVGQNDKAIPVRVVNDEAQLRGIQMAPGATDYLVNRVGHDVGLLLTELEKCSLRVGADGVVTQQIIDEMTRRKPQETIFDLLDAIGARQTPKAMTMLRELLDGGEVPERILATLVSHLRRLWQVRAMMDQKIPLNAGGMDGVPPELAAQFPEGGIVEKFSGFSWKISQLQAQARAFSQAQIQAALERTFETDLAMKGIDEDGGTSELLLERLVMRL